MEIWKDIKGFEGQYQVSNYGRVMSLTRYVKHPKGTLRLMNGRILACSGENKNMPYKMVTLCRGGINKKYLVHQLVARAFCDNPNNLPQVNHKDENKGNNNADNLEWVTSRENRVHANISRPKRSKYIGVAINSSGSWRSFIMINGERKYLGSYPTDYEAHLAYKKASEEAGIKNRFI